MKKKKGVARLKKDLWKTFSKYKRLSEPDRCFSCGRPCQGSNKQVGHFIPRSVCPPPLYFSPTNNQIQCYNCNINLDGNWPEYLKAMIENYGQDTVDDLLAQRNKPVKWTPNDYEVMIQVYKAKLAAL